MLEARLGKHLDFSEVDKPYTLEKQRLQTHAKNAGKDVLANSQTTH